MTGTHRLGLVTLCPSVKKGRKIATAQVREETMNWFSRTTSIAGIQVSNWMMLVLVAVVVIWIIYSFVAHP